MKSISRNAVLLAVIGIVASLSHVFAADQKQMFHAPERKFFKLDRSGYAPGAHSFYTNKIDTSRSQFRPEEYKTNIPRSSLSSSTLMQRSTHFTHSNKIRGKKFLEDVTEDETPITGDNDHVILSLFADGKTLPSASLEDADGDTPLRPLHNVYLFQ